MRARGEDDEGWEGSEMDGSELEGADRISCKCGGAWSLFGSPADPDFYIPVQKQGDKNRFRLFTLHSQNAIKHDHGVMRGVE